MQIADLEGTPLINVAIRCTPVSLTICERRRAMALVRELQTLGFIDNITPFSGAIHGPTNDGTRTSLLA